jgi:hypothetical protein
MDESLGGKGISLWETRRGLLQFYFEHSIRPPYSWKLRTEGCVRLKVL